MVEYLNLGFPHEPTESISYVNCASSLYSGEYTIFGQLMRFWSWHAKKCVWCDKSSSKDIINEYFVLCIKIIVFRGWHSKYLLYQLIDAHVALWLSWASNAAARLDRRRPVRIIFWFRAMYGVAKDAVWCFRGGGWRAFLMSILLWV